MFFIYIIIPFFISFDYYFHLLNGNRVTFICRITRYPVFFTSTRYKKPNLRNAGTELKVFRPLTGGIKGGRFR